MFQATESTQLDKPGCPSLRLAGGMAHLVLVIVLVPVSGRPPTETRAAVLSDTSQFFSDTAIAIVLLVIHVPLGSRQILPSHFLMASP